VWSPAYSESLLLVCKANHPEYDLHTLHAAEHVRVPRAVQQAGYLLNPDGTLSNGWSAGAQGMSGDDSFLIASANPAGYDGPGSLGALPCTNTDTDAAGRTEDSLDSVTGALAYILSGGGGGTGSGRGQQGRTIAGSRSARELQMPTARCDVHEGQSGLCLGLAPAVLCPLHMVQS
jgi:hypothetical protein